MDIIKFSDLFDEGGINSGLKGLVTQVEGVKGSLLEMLKEVKEASASIAQSLSSTTSTTKGGRDDTRQQAGNVEQLYSAYQELTKAIAECNKNVANLTAAQARSASTTKVAGGAASEQRREMGSLAQSYATLSSLIEQTGVKVEELLTSQKQLNIAQKNGEVAAKSATGSYNQLYAQYNLIKNVLNAMSAEMRNAEGAGKVWEAEALRIMNVMKGMQEATGKHTLSVGDYTKAFNGLSIATQQVLREMPTLANSFQQFFIAISNNVPIFVDNLNAVAKATGSMTTAIKAVGKAIFSWNTVLLVVLTVLPKLAQAIHNKRKAQEEDNKATKTQISLLNLLHEAMLAVLKAQAEDLSKTRTLVAIMDDYNRSMEDRITAAQILKNTYEEQLEMYSAEEIALGKAKVKIDEITQSLKIQAQARALLNKITEAYVGQIDAEDKATEIGQTRVYEYGFKNVKGLYDYVQNLLKTTKMSEEQIKKSIAFVAKGDKGVWKQYEAYKAARKEMEEYGKTIDALTKRIDVLGLAGDSGKGGKGGKGKKSLDQSLDYYWEWAESVASIIDDAEERELALNDVKYEKSKATYQKILDEQKKAKNLTAEQEKYLTDIILNLETERQQERLAIIDKYYQKVRQGILDGYDELLVVEEEKLDEEDFTISGKYDKILANISTQITASRENLNDALVNGTYKEAKEEGAILKDLLAQKIKAEGEYQKELLEMRRKSGNITQEKYEIELANINAAIDKAIRQLTGKNRRKMDIWDLLLGETQKDEYGNVFKKLDDEGKAFVNQLIDSLSTAMEYMDEFMDKRIEMAEIAVEAAQKESEAAKSALESEMEARANGYANNVDLARREYEEKLALEEKAVEEKKRLQKVQEGIDTLTQISSLVTATAQLWASYSSLPGIGQALAIAAIAAMWGSFAAAKIQAAQLANAKTYGEGGTEYINYGGSHASGNDVDFGRTKDGRARRVEKGEVVSVINKKNVEKYGVSRIENIINALNNGTFEKQYISSKSASILSSKSASILSSKSSLVESTERNNIADMYSLAFSMLGLPTEGGADLSTIEKGIKTLVSQNEVRVVPTPYGRIEYRGNNTRIIRNS